MAVPIPGYGIRVTLFFDDVRTGWTETHYDTQSATLQAAVTLALTNLVPPREFCMATGPYLKYIRASRDGTFRDAQVQAVPANPVGPQNPQNANNLQWLNSAAAVEWTCVLLRGVGGDLYRKNIYLSGVPYFDPTDVRVPTDDPLLVVVINNYQAALQNNVYGFPVWIRDPVVIPPVQISSITPNPAPGTGYIFTTSAPHGLPATWNPVQTTYRAFLHGMQFNPTPGSVRRPSPSPNGGYPFQVIQNTSFVLPTWVFPGTEPDR